MSNLPVLKYRAIDEDGNAISGAKLYFYEAGTETPADTYSDYERTTPNANPVVSASTGYFPEIYLDPNQGYYVVLTDADDTLIWDVDDIYATSLGASDLTTRLERAGSSPTQYGAVGDGASDESEYVQDAIDNAECVVDLLGLTYRCDYSIEPKDGVEIINGTLDFSNCADAAFVKMAGTIGDAVSLDGSVAIGDDSVDMDTSGIEAGDVLFIRSADTWRGSSGYRGELLVATGPASGGEYVAPAVRDAYGQEVGSIRKVSMAGSLRMRGVTVIGSTTASGNGVHVDLQYCRNVVLRDCVFQAVKTSSIRLRTCMDVSIEDCRIEDGAAAAIGVSITECCEGIRINGQMERLAQFVDIGELGTLDGVCRDIVLDKLRAFGCTTNGVAVHEMSENISFEHCSIDAIDAPAVLLEDTASVRFIGCYLRAGGGRALYATGACDGLAVNATVLVRTDTDGPCAELAGASAGDITGVAATGNHFDGGTYGLVVSNAEAGACLAYGNSFDDQATGTTSGLPSLGQPAVLDANGLVSANPANATATPGASKIAMANGSGKLAAGWGGSASTLATLDANSKVVQDPASASTDQGIGAIPKANASGIITVRGINVEAPSPTTGITVTDMTVTAAAGSGSSAAFVGSCGAGTGGAFYGTGNGNCAGGFFVGAGDRAPVHLESRSEPAYPVAGDIYYGGGHFYGYNGSSWVQLD